MADPLRVFQLIKGLGRGGAEVLLSEGLYSANREEFEYGFGYFLPQKSALAETLRRQGVTVEEFTAPTALAMAFRVGAVTRFLRRWRADILHCHLPLSAVVGRLAARRVGIPVIYTEHGPMHHYNPATRLVNLLTWHLQDQVIAVSQEVAESIARHGGKGVPVRVIDNAVPVDRFSSAAADGASVRLRLGWSEATTVVGTVAVFRAQKRLHDWLEVARRLHRDRPDVRFLVVGDGPLRDELTATRSRLGLDGVVHFAGLQSDVRPYLAAMDVFLMTSGFEGTPVALLEAMAMQRPVVATGVGGVPTVLEEPGSGVICRPGDLEGLHAAVRSLVAEPARRRLLGAAARRRIELRYSMKAMVAEIEGIYRELGRPTA